MTSGFGSASFLPMTISFPSLIAFLMTPDSMGSSLRLTKYGSFEIGALIFFSSSSSFLDCQSWFVKNLSDLYLKNVLILLNIILKLTCSSLASQSMSFICSLLANNWALISSLIFSMSKNIQRIHRKLIQKRTHNLSKILLVVIVLDCNITKSIWFWKKYSKV